MKKIKNGWMIVIMTVLVILIMGMSFGFRYMVNHKVVTQLGEAYIDPETEVPYLTEMDSYYHLRMTRDIEVYGHAGDTENNGEPWDSLSYAPYGRSADGYRPLMAYIAIYTYDLLSSFSQVTLEQVAYWQGAIISALVVIPVFVLAYRLKGMVAAVTASVLSAINYGYFVHTVPGFYDTDTVISWTSCFLFCFGCLFIDSLMPQGNGDEADKRTIRRLRAGRVIYALLFILSLLLLVGSWYIYYMFAGILAFAVLVFVVLRCINAEKGSRKAVIREAAPHLIFIAVLGLAILICEPNLMSDMAATIRGVFTSGEQDLFPNALVSVAEMRKPAFIAGGLSGLFQMRVLSGADIGVINAVGGIVPCLGAIAMCVMLVAGIIKKSIKFDHVLLVIWFLITAVLAVRSWRFIMLFAVPVAILAGMFTGSICTLMREKKMMDWQLFAGMLVILMLFPAIYGAYRSSGDSVPGVNRPLHETLAYIRDNSPDDTILTSWWDYGYFYEEKAVRRTLFDGGSQNGKRIYWVAKAMATSDEKLSRNIIRMLAGAGEDGTDRMLELFGENEYTLELMETMLSGDEEEAVRLLENEGLETDECEDVVKLLFPEITAPITYIITPEMTGIAPWFGKFGFPNDEMYEENGYTAFIDRTEYNENNGKAGWQFVKDDTVINLVVENKNGQYKAYTEYAESQDENTDKANPYPIEKVIVWQDGESSEYIMDNVDAAEGTGCTVIMNMDSEVPNLSLVTTLLYDSVFGRLYYMGGEGMEYYIQDVQAPGSAALFLIE